VSFPALTALTAAIRNSFAGNVLPSTDYFSYWEVVADSAPEYWYIYKSIWGNTNNGITKVQGSSTGFFNNGIVNTYPLSSNPYDPTDYGGIFGYLGDSYILNQAGYQGMIYYSETTQFSFAGEMSGLLVFQYKYSADAPAAETLIGCWDPTDTANAEWRIVLFNFNGNRQLNLHHYQLDGTSRAPANGVEGFEEGGEYDDNRYHILQWEREDPSVVGSKFRVWIDGTLKQENTVAGDGNTVRTGTEVLTVGGDASFQVTEQSWSQFVLWNKLLTVEQRELMFDFAVHANQEASINFTKRYKTSTPINFEEEVKFSSPVHYIPCDDDDGTTYLTDLARPIDSLRWGVTQGTNTQRTVAKSSPYLTGNATTISSTSAIQAFAKKHTDGLVNDVAFCFDWAQNNFNTNSAILMGILNQDSSSADVYKSHKLIKLANGTWEWTGYWSGTSYTHILPNIDSTHPMYDNDDWNYFQLMYDRSTGFGYSQGQMTLFINGVKTCHFPLTNSTGRCTNMTAHEVAPSDNRCLKWGSSTAGGGAWTSNVDAVQVYRGFMVRDESFMRRRASWWVSGVRDNLYIAPTRGAWLTIDTVNPTDDVQNFSFDNVNGTTIFDDAGTEQNITITGTGEYTTGLSGNALTKTNTANHYHGVNPFPQASLQSGTIAFFMKVDMATSGTGTASWGAIATFGADYSNSGIIIDIHTDTGAMRGLIGDNASYIGVGWGAKSTDLRDGTWHHLCYTFEWNGVDTILRGYIDGRSRENSEYKIPANDVHFNTSELNVFNRGSTGDALVGAAIEDLRVFNRTASPYEVLAMANTRQLLDVNGLHPGTLVGSPTYFPGQFNNALSLNGSTQYVEFADSTGLRPTQLCVGGWFRISDTSSTDRCIIQNWSDGTNKAGWRLHFNTTGVLVFSVASNTGDILDTDFATHKSIDDHRDGNWHFAFAMYTGEKLYLYVDNIQQGTSTVYSGGLAYETISYPRLGVHETGSFTGWHFNGDLEAFRVFDSWIGKGEGQALYNEGLGVD